MRSDDRIVLACFAVVFGGVFLMACLGVLASVSLYNRVATVVHQTQQSGAITQSVLQTEAWSTLGAQIANLQSTERASQAGPTNIQILLKDAKTWEVLFKDTFDTNENNWLDAPIAFTNVEGNTTISDGKYYWDLQAKDGFVYSDYPSMERLSDFYLEVEMEQVSGSIQGKSGLIFRRASDSYFYYFSITKDQQYEVYLYQAGSWERIIPPTFRDEIQSGQPNKLAVIGIQQELYFFINDTFVNFVVTSATIRGNVGVFSSLSVKGENVVLAFDNFEVRVPPSEE